MGSIFNERPSNIQYEETFLTDHPQKILVRLWKLFFIAAGWSIITFILIFDAFNKTFQLVLFPAIIRKIMPPPSSCFLFHSTKLSVLIFSLLQEELNPRPQDVVFCSYTLFLRPSIMSLSIRHTHLSIRHGIKFTTPKINWYQKFCWIPITF